jgi:hypothetical protein
MFHEKFSEASAGDGDGAEHSFSVIRLGTSLRGM